MSDKAATGNFFEDFSLGQRFDHATPRTVTEGDVALYGALYGSRFAVHSADIFALDIGFEGGVIDDLLTFHIVFGKSVPDISLNAVANLGYAEGLFATPVLTGDTLVASSEVIGLKQTSHGDAGVVYVRTTGRNQVDDAVVQFVRWVLVRKRDPGAPGPETHVPDLAAVVPADRLFVPGSLDMVDYNTTLSGGRHLWEDYEVGEKIDHIDAMTIEESDHMMAARLYQNPARVHFNQHAEAGGRFGRRIVYGGHVISLARALSFNGLANAFHIAAINGGRHVAPAFAGDTIYAWSQVLDKQPLAGHEDIGALRLRLVAAKDQPCGAFPDKHGEGQEDGSVVLDFDYWALMPRAG